VVTTAAELIHELQAARWFGGKSRAIRAARVIDRAAWLSFVEVSYAHGAPETYVLAEAFDAPEVGRRLLDHFSGTRMPTERGGMLVFEPTHLLADVDRTQTEPISLLRGEQSNSSLRYGDALILKLFRRLQFGPNPEVEIGRQLTENSDFHGMPAVVGSLDYRAPDGQTASLALLQQFVPNRGDAWRTTLERLSHVLAGADPQPSIDALARLGRTTGDLHVALAHGQGDFAAAPITRQDVADWRSAIHEEVEHAAQGLRHRGIQVDLGALLHRADCVEALIGAQKTRHHGDYHLGQVLECADGEFVIIDFEGEPSKPLAVRREKRSPLRDVAGMLRSFDYARHAAVRATPGGDTKCAGEWYASVRNAFLESYERVVRAGAPMLLPREIHEPLAALELEKAAYEVVYELNNRPDWLPIPLAALSEASATL
jgi:trehalose synthase-fused probable maltokinase